MSSKDLQAQIEQLQGLVAGLGLQVARLDSELEEVRERCFKVEGEFEDYKVQKEFELVDNSTAPISSSTPLSSGSCIAALPISSSTPLRSGSCISAAASGVPLERISSRCGCVDPSLSSGLASRFFWEAQDQGGQQSVLGG